jgi:flagellar basal-body rod modification protein FlgD
MTTITSSTNTAIGSTAAASSAATSATSAKEASERFLKLLVTQLQNQDPMNPVDNAQMTSQMAQISTVSGIEKLNTTVEGLTSQFMQMQAMQGASLVGRDVILKGDKLSVPAGGVPQGSFEIAAAADHVKVEMLSPAGLVVDTVNLGAQSSGRHDFSWPGGSNISESAGYRFRVTALSGATTLASTALMRDKVDAVNTGGASLTLELARSGNVAYADIQALN